jgi:hypothetical protein
METTQETIQQGFKVNCNRCQVEVFVEVTGMAALNRLVMRSGMLCDDCAKVVADEDTLLIHHEAEAGRLSAWHSLCPPAYRDTDPVKLPRPSLLKRVLGWQYGPRGLVLHGKTGLGKSRCAWMLMRREYEHGRQLACVNYTGLYEYSELFSRSTEAASQWVWRLGRVSVLLLDDVFKAKFTDSFEQALFAVVASRAESNLPTIVTCNDTGESLKERLTQDRADALIRRIRESSDNIAFV